MKTIGTVDIKELNASFSFFFDDKIIYLIKNRNINENTTFKTFYTFNETLEFDLLNGKTGMGGDIYFINVKIIQSSIIPNEFLGQCQYLILPETHNSYYSEFDSIVFKGKIVDKFYSPYNCIDYKDCEYSRIYKQQQDGSKIIAIKKPQDFVISKSLNLNNIDVSLILSVDLDYKSDPNSICSITSCLNLIFESSLKINEITTWYRTIHQSFQFLLNRQEIEFDQVFISKKNNKTLERVARVYSFTYDKTFESNKFSYNCVNHVLVIDNIEKLINIMLDKQINMYHLPSSDEDHMLLTPEKLVFTASSFEYEYDLMYNLIENSNSNIEIIQGRLFHELDLIDSDYKGKNSKIRSIAKSMKNMIGNYNNTLESKIAEVIENNLELLLEQIVKIAKIYGTTSNSLEIGKNFANARNKNAHGTLSPYKKEEISAFMILRILVYVMILKRCDINYVNIKQILEIHF